MCQSLAFNTNITLLLFLLTSINQFPFVTFKDSDNQYSTGIVPMQAKKSCRVQTPTRCSTSLQIVGLIWNACETLVTAEAGFKSLYWLLEKISFFESHLSIKLCLWAMDHGLWTTDINDWFCRLSELNLNWQYCMIMCKVCLIPGFLGAKN